MNTRLIDRKDRISAYIIIYLIFALNIVSAQELSKTYFELNSNTIAIEAEFANGWGGWFVENASSASDNAFIIFPESDTLTFLPSADTYIDLYYPDANFGTLPQLLVKGKGDDKRGFFMTPWWNGKWEAFEQAAFLKFDVSGISRPIVEAKILLFCETSGVGGGVYSLDPMMDNLNWVETEATWNNKPSTHYDGNTFQCFIDSVVAAGQWTAFDVTEALYGKKNGTYSFGLVMQQNQPAAWSSKEGTHPPYLWIRTKKYGYQLTGNCTYYSNNNPIPNVAITATGEFLGSALSNSSGNYIFESIRSGASFAITPAKAIDSDVHLYDITSYDAALTAQAALNLISLSADQQLAANVNRDNVITTYDASLIARYAVSLPRLSDSHVGEWVFQPDSRSYTNMNSDMNDANFRGIILGNVHGGWAQNGGSKSRLVKSLSLAEIKLEKGSNELSFPISVPKSREIISFDIAVTYDANVLDFAGVKSFKINPEVKLFYNDLDGKVLIGAYSGHPFDLGREFVTIRFKIKKKNLNSTTISLDKLLLNNDIEYRGKAVALLVNQNDLPDSYKLYQNYPNPYLINGARDGIMSIEFEVPRSEHVSVEIYNTLGQHIRTLKNGFVERGHHRIYWDGKDERGQIVSSGIYVYQLKTKDFVSRRRLVFLR